MSANNFDIALQVAQSLLGHLADPLNRELKDLLERAEKGEPISRELNKLLYQYDNVRLWMDEQVSMHSQTKRLESRGGISMLAGNPNIVSASQKWICTENKYDHWMLVIQEGEDPPICEEHHLIMVREFVRGE